MAVESAVLLSGTVMDRAASLMNDTARSKYSYTVQLPYLNTAMQELQEFFEENDIPVSDTKTSPAIDIPVGSTTIEFGATAPEPKLPSDLVEPKLLWIRQYGIDPYVPVTKVENLALNFEGVEITQILNWIWESQRIKFLPCIAINQVKIEYIRQLFEQVTDENYEINIVNSASYLQFRTAALLAQYVEEDQGRAQSLNNDAGLAMDRVLNVGTKGRQSIAIRRRPFRSGYKIRYNG